MKHLKKLSLLIVLLSCWSVQAQRIDYALNALHKGANIKPIQLTAIDSDLLGLVYVADSVNYIAKITQTGEVLSTIKLDRISENEISYVNFTKIGFDVFYYHYVPYHTIRSLARVNESLGQTQRYELFNKDSIYNERYFAFGVNKFVWFNHCFNNVVSMVVGHMNDTGNATVKTYQLQSHYIELNHLLGSKEDQFIAYFNSKRYLLSINDSLNLDTVRLDIDNHKLVKFNHQLLRTVEYNKNQWNYTALLNSKGDTVFNKAKFDFIGSDDWLLPYNNSLWVVNRVGGSGNDSMSVTLFDTSYNEVFTRYINSFMVKAVAANTSKNEIYLFGADSNGIILKKVSAAIFNMGTQELQTESLFNVYPNPTTQQISFSQVINNGWVQIFNTQGQVVLSTSQAQNLDVSHLPSGLYFYQITNKQQQIVAHGKIIKQ